MRLYLLVLTSLTLLSSINCSQHPSITPIKSILQEIYPPSTNGPVTLGENYTSNDLYLCRLQARLFITSSYTSSSIHYTESVSKTGIPTPSDLSLLRTEHGLNALPKQKSQSIWSRIGHEFKDRLVQILLCTAAVSAVFSFLELREHKLLHPDVPISPLSVFVLHRHPPPLRRDRSRR